MWHGINGISHNIKKDRGASLQKKILALPKSESLTWHSGSMRVSINSERLPIWIKPQPESEADLLKTLESFIQEKDWNKTIMKATQGLSLSIPIRDKITLLFYRGIAFWATGRFCTALTDFQSAINLNPDNKLRFKLLYLRSFLYLAMSDHFSAAHDLSAAVQFNKDLIQDFLNSTLKTNSKSEWKAAIQKELETDPSGCSAHILAALESLMTPPHHFLTAKQTLAKTTQCRTPRVSDISAIEKLISF